MSTEKLNSANDLPDDVEQLKTIIAQRDAAIASQSVALAERDSVIAERDVMLAEHRNTIDQHETTIDGHVDAYEKLLKKANGLEQQLARLLRKQYGPQKERIDPDQLTLFSSEELTKIAEELQSGPEDSVPPDDGSDETIADGADAVGDSSTNSRTPKGSGKGHGRRSLPDHLPREEVRHELPEEERACPCCGELRCEIGTAISEQLEYVPASLKVIQHHRVKYACPACEENVVTAPKPAQPINKGLPGPGLLAHTVLSKYGDYLPLYRQEDILSRCKILIRRSTLCDWVAAVADVVKPLYDLMCDRVRQSRVIHTDDTGIKMLESPQCRNCKFWTYVGDDDNPYAVYEFSLTREGENAVDFLEDYSGYLHADAFSGYDAVFAPGDIIEVACMAHSRRYWWEAKETDARRAHEAIGFITRLYRLEEEFTKAKLTGDELRDARQQYSVPILTDFKTWLTEHQHSVLPKSEIGKAFTYTLNQWDALCRYTQDGVLSIDNNLAERQMKLPAIGRKNWLFVGSEEGGDRAAILLSLMASARLCHVDPLAWLTAVLKELPVRMSAWRKSLGRPPTSSNKPPDLSDLLPDAWLADHPADRRHIDDIRQKERARSRQQKINKRKNR